MSPDDLIVLNDEIAGMARAGLPLDQGLKALADDMMRGELQHVTAAVAVDLRAGRTLPEALERQGNNVPPYYAHLLAAGIRTGRLSSVLTTLTGYARTVADLRSLVLESLLYPATILLLSSTLFGFLCYYLLPQFDKMFHDFNMRLPWMTEVAMAFGRYPTQLVVLPIVGLIGLTLLARYVFRRTAAGRRAWARLIYAIPIAGTLIRAARLAAFADLLGLLVDHDTPLPEAFRLAGLASSDPETAATAALVHERLTQGHPLGEALHGRGMVPEWVSWMVGLGEKRGTLGPALHQVADTYRRQVEMRAALFRSVLPGFLLFLVAGVIVAFFILSMLMPMFKLMEGLSK